MRCDCYSYFSFQGSVLLVRLFFYWLDWLLCNILGYLVFSVHKIRSSPAVPIKRYVCSSTSMHKKLRTQPLINARYPRSNRSRSVKPLIRNNKIDWRISEVLDEHAFISYTNTHINQVMRSSLDMKNRHSRSVLFCYMNLWHNVSGKLSTPTQPVH